MSAGSAWFSALMSYVTLLRGRCVQQKGLIAISPHTPWKGNKPKNKPKQTYCFPGKGTSTFTTPLGQQRASSWAPGPNWTVFVLGVGSRGKDLPHSVFQLQTLPSLHHGLVAREKSNSFLQAMQVIIFLLSPLEWEFWIWMILFFKSHYIISSRDTGEVILKVRLSTY